MIQHDKIFMSARIVFKIINFDMNYAKADYMVNIALLLQSRHFSFIAGRSFAVKDLHRTFLVSLKCQEANNANIRLFHIFAGRIILTKCQEKMISHAP